MAAAKGPGPRCLAELQGQHTAALNDAAFVPQCDAVITISEDKTAIVWLKRDSGEYWPSIRQPLPSAVSAMAYDLEAAEKLLFLGLDGGQIMLYAISDDFNSMQLKTTLPAHQGRVTVLLYDRASNVLLSGSRDKAVHICNVETAALMHAVNVGARCTALQFDSNSQNAFVGDHSGKITVLKVEDCKLVVVSVLEGHQASVQSLLWSPDRQWLFSGSLDKSVVVWDIGGCQGVSYELHGHRGKVRGLAFVQDKSQLLSVGDDKSIVVWTLDVDRTETADWAESGVCQVCDVPFLWNLSGMWENKQISFNRQHHCRKCGKAVCHACSSRTSTLPKFGFEFPVRMCNGCFAEIEDADRKPLAKFCQAKQAFTIMHLIPGTRTLLTCDSTHTVTIWSIARMLEDAKDLDVGPVVGIASPTENDQSSAASRPTSAEQRPTSAERRPTSAESRPAPAEAPREEAKPPRQFGIRSETAEEAALQAVALQSNLRAEDSMKASLFDDIMGSGDIDD